MDDLAESIDDLICVFDQQFDMDRLALLVFVSFLVTLVTVFSFWSLFKAFRHRHDKKAIVKESNEIKTPVSSTLSPRAQKRSRLSPAKDFITSNTIQKGKCAFVAAPQCVGSDLISVLWTNDLFLWIWNDLHLVQELIQIWIRNINSVMNKLVNEQGIEVQLIRLLPETSAPNLDNVTCECNSNEDVTISCDCDANPTFQLKCTRKCEDKIEHSHYRVTVTKFHGRLKIFCITEKSKMNIKFSGWPEIKIVLSPVGSILKSNSKFDEEQLQEVIKEILQTAFRTTEQTFDLSQYSNCPRLIRNLQMPESHDLLNRNNIISSTPIKNDLKQINKKKQLLIKIEAAHNIAENCKKPYCVVEFDDPLQKNQTTVKYGQKSPIWNEPFLFDISDYSAEILFEILDLVTDPPTFLGHCIISVNELMTNELKRHVLPLQDKPFEKNNVQGALSIESAIIETDEIPFIINSNDQLIELLSTLPRTKSIKEINNNLSSIVDTNMEKKPEINTESLVIHNIERETEKKTDEISNSMNTNMEVQNLPNNESSSSFDSRKSRSRRRNFFGTIKRKLQKAKDERSRSLQNHTSFSHPDWINESERHETDHSSRKSSVSEKSGYSGYSSKSYFGEDSALLLEINENGVNTYYAVSFGMYEKLKRRKNSTKLHVYNDHIFVAKHISGNTKCGVCDNAIKLRFGKQGYECRDCFLKCHKTCHVKTPNKCLNSSIGSYIV